MAKGSKEFTLIRPPVLLVHGIWSYSQELDPIEEYLKNHGFQYVFSYNYGNNPPADWRDGANGDIDQIVLDLRGFVCNMLETRLDKIDNVNWSRFDIVAHSAGGLVARKYIYNEPERVRKLVTIATPHYGSDAANILAFWWSNSGHIDYDPSWLPTGHRKDVTYDERVRLLVDDARRLAGADLMIGNYGVMVEQLTIPGDVVINDDASEYLQVPEEGRTRLTSDDVGKMQLTNLGAGEFIQNLNTPDYDHPLHHISLLCIAANRSNLGFFTVPNDGIVTLNSATSLAIRRNRPYQVIQNTDHTGVKKLEDTMSRVACFLNDRVHMRFSAYSPVRIHVYDRDGNHTGLREDDTLETGIPSSEYFEENGASHVIVYDGGEYRAVYEAYSDGSAAFSITRQVADEGLRIVSYNDVTVGRGSVYTVTVNPTPEEPMLEVDLNGDGITDERIKPSDYQYYPPRQIEGIQPNGFRVDVVTIAGVILIAILVVALLIRRSKAATVYVPAYPKDSESPTEQAQAAVLCPSCGSRNPPDARNCIKCGKSTKQFNYCEECGREIPSGSAYCPICGDRQGVE
ncbi:alpha/beta fold hydrolase [Candidatus Bathyarchaeota archaeon]|nr:alpha/beta fold hydrolase [Candidatus Bathyarchaeota archaeon]